MSIAHCHFYVVMAEDFLQGKDVAARHHEVRCERMAQNVGKLATRKHDGGFVHHRQKLEIAVSKEFEAVQGNDFLIQLFADRDAAVLFAFGPDESDSILSDLGPSEIHSFAPACPGAQTDFTTRARRVLWRWQSYRSSVICSWVSQAISFSAMVNLRMLSNGFGAVHSPSCLLYTSR